jgi:hypothetical protein
LVVETAWSHLSIVYDLLQAFFKECPRDPHFTPDFERSFFRLFHSPDFNEREQVVIFFFQYVGVYPEREKELWKAMAGTLVQYRQGYGDPFAVTPILVFLSRRFADRPPGLEELRWQIYRDAVVPLASSPHLLSFKDRIEIVVRIMAAGRPIETVTFVQYLVKMFPFRKVTKQVPYIAWLERMAQSVARPNFGLVARPLFVVYAALALSDSSNVVEASFRIWENGTLTPMIIDNARVIYPLMYTALMKAVRVHWKAGTQNRASWVLRAMRDCHSSLFEHLSLAQKKRNTQADSPSDTSPHTENMRKWATIARTAGRNDSTLHVGEILADFGRYYRLLSRFGQSP